ncbi:MAG: Nif3-like dinuclear metal center hexameric protein, partial [Bacteroidaceae bacterium]|nr:Nif3-like dinuclear metal center hexameric protein [Bacteroidaceae bacterium]
MKIKEIVDALERFAPLPLQDGFDNAGMQVGLTDADCAGALLCLDVTEEVLDEAIKEDCNLVVSHHPLIFKGIKSLTASNYVERCVMKAIKHDITIFSAHTNLDNAVNGVNFKMAEKIGLKHVEMLEPRADGWLSAGAGV